MRACRAQQALETPRHCRSWRLRTPGRPLQHCWSPAALARFKTSNQIVAHWPLPVPSRTCATVTPGRPAMFMERSISMVSLSTCQGGRAAVHFMRLGAAMLWRRAREERDALDGNTGWRSDSQHAPHGAGNAARLGSAQLPTLSTSSCALSTQHTALGTENSAPSTHTRNSRARHPPRWRRC